VRQAEALTIFVKFMRRRGHSPETVVVNRAAARRFLAAVGGSAPRLGRRDVERYLADLHRRGLAGSTRARVLGVVRSLCVALVEAGALPADPSAGLHVDAGEPSPRVVPTEAGVAELLSAADVRPRSGASPALALRDRVLVELLYGLGLRSSEARAALVTDLNLADGSLAVRPAKRGPPRTLPLPRAALPHLSRYLEEGRPLLVRHGVDEGRLLVSKTGRPLRHCSDVGTIVAKLAERAGVRCHPHALRRGLATHLVGAGVNVRAVQVLLGHESLEVTQRYVAVDRAGLRATVALLEGRGSGTGR